MNAGFAKAKRISQKHELMGLVTRIDYGFNGNDPEWVKEYVTELLENNDLDLDRLIIALRDMDRLCSPCYFRDPKNRPPPRPIQCELCGFTGSFCKHKLT